MVRFLGIGKESTYRTAVSATEYINIISESIAPDWDRVKLEEAGYRFATDKLPGGFKVTGDISLYVDAQTITKFLEGLLGNVSTTNDGEITAYKHTFTPANSLPSYTLEIFPEYPADYSRQIAGTGILSMRLEAEAGSPLTATIGVLGAKEELITPSSPTPSFANTSPLPFNNSSVEIEDSAVATVEAFRLDVSNGIPDDAFVLNDMFLPALRLEGGEIMGEMDIAFTSWDYYKLFYGSSSATEPSETPDTVKIELIATGGSTGSGTAGYENYKLAITLPKCRLDTSNANFDRRSRIVQRLGFEALHDTSSGYAIQIEVVNTKSSP